MRDDVVLQTADDVRVRVPVFHTQKACAGAVTAYLLRRIAYRAGAYAPGIQELLFHDLTTPVGAQIERVLGWMQSKTAMFHQLGYRLYFKWATDRTDVLADWVREGRGYRGATVATGYRVLHPQGPFNPPNHAVGLAIDRPHDGKDEDLVMIDPWPGVGEPDTVRVPDNLDSARREFKWLAIKFFWVGWS